MRLPVRAAVKIPPLDLRFVPDKQFLPQRVSHETERPELKIADYVRPILALIEKEEHPLPVRERGDAGNEPRLAAESAARLVDLNDASEAAFDGLFNRDDGDRLDAEWRGFHV